MTDENRILKPCPFCGAEGELYSGYDAYSTDSSFTCVGCSKCDCRLIEHDPHSGGYDCAGDARRAWNTRAHPTPESVFTPEQEESLKQAALAAIADAVAIWNTGKPRSERVEICDGPGMAMHVEIAPSEDTSMVEELHSLLLKEPLRGYDSGFNQGIMTAIGVVANRQAPSEIRDIRKSTGEATAAIGPGGQVVVSGSLSMGGAGSDSSSPGLQGEIPENGPNEPTPPAPEQPDTFKNTAELNTSAEHAQGLNTSEQPDEATADSRAVNLLDDMRYGRIVQGTYHFEGACIDILKVLTRPERESSNAVEQVAAIKSILATADSYDECVAEIEKVLAFFPPMPVSQDEQARRGSSDA